MKIVVIGGSSHLTPALFQYLASVDLPAPMAFVLVGRDRARLAAVGRASRVLLGSQSPIRVDAHPWDDEGLGGALAGADLIVLQARIGGARARIHDETCPLEHGICGDESLGPGGLAAAWRNWPLVDRVLGAVADRAPEARVLVLTSPVGIVTGAANMAWPRLHALGICELPWTTLLEVAAAVDVEPAGLEWDYVGISHLGWFHRITDGRRDLVLDFARHRGDGAAFPRRGLVEETHAVPTRYWRLHYEMTAVIEEQRARGVSRGMTVERLGKAALAAFAGGSRDEIVARLAARGSHWYDRAVGPLIGDLAGGASGTPFFLTTRNDGFWGEEPAGRMLEIPHRVIRGRIERCGNLAVPPRGVTAALKPFLESEQLAIEAVVARDRSRLGDALAVHPWSRNRDDVRGALLSAVTRDVDS